MRRREPQKEVQMPIIAVDPRAGRRNLPVGSWCLTLHRLRLDAKIEISLTPYSP